jgi:hypothetical protein
MYKPRLAVKYWCLQALSFTRQRHHREAPACDGDLLPEDLMDAAVDMMPEPPSREELMSDDFLDAIEGVPADGPPNGRDPPDGPDGPPPPKRRRGVSSAPASQPESKSKPKAKPRHVSKPTGSGEAAVVEVVAPVEPGETRASVVEVVAPVEPGETHDSSSSSNSSSSASSNDSDSS